ncbi:hypothetical protein BDK51DRAFT_51420 [Blyttiomyces helicus]|uniref:Uncharacterized protein n=1 Tax=Blyttiomyces helicus TaxID=388810 RepID=A0A4P9W727_9FUNG|nr:hypothetical protein BDK51DRAFT_51420 [Blyttiomyces helicus]|eukprot:RKO86808.1 hypothetical protein BDK51DRAFT_51420 [Blyttiomyces helicus]
MDRRVLRAKEAGLAGGKPEGAEAELTLASLDMVRKTSRDAGAAKVRVDVVMADEARRANGGVERVSTAGLALLGLQTRGGRSEKRQPFNTDVQSRPSFPQNYAGVVSRVNLDRRVLQAKEAGLAGGKHEAAEATLTLASLEMFDLNRDTERGSCSPIFLRGGTDASRQPGIADQEHERPIVQKCNAMPTHVAGLGAGAGTASNDGAVPRLGEHAHETGLTAGKEVVTEAGVAQATLNNKHAAHRSGGVGRRTSWTYGGDMRPDRSGDRSGSEHGSGEGVDKLHYEGVEVAEKVLLSGSMQLRKLNPDLDRNLLITVATKNDSLAITSHSDNGTIIELTGSPASPGRNCTFFFSIHGR